MATHLDLEEQEQLDQLKTFWKQYGNLVTWVLIAVLAAYAAWNGWNWWQRDQAVKASAMFDQLDTAAQAGDADQAGRVFADMKERFPRTAFTEQAGLLAAKVQFDKGQADAALATLAWVSASAADAEYQTVARLRAAGVLLDQKKYDDALKQLDAAAAPEFTALVADRPTLDDLNRRYAERILRDLGGNKTRAAEVLGIDPSTLHRKLSRFGVEA